VRIRGQQYRTLWELPAADGIGVIDQRHLPHRFVTAELRTPAAVAEAIREMWVRGAPLIGAAAGYALYLAARLAPDDRAASS
jgi:methylthioribose-1-phosphate isomerase